MPPKKATAAAATKKAAPSHASYRDMIKDAIVNLKERNGSSRQSLKKYVQSNNNITVTSQAAFDSQFNKAIKVGVEKGEFSQPKGPSGPVRLAKKEESAKPVAKKPAAPKPAAPATTTKKVAAKKTGATAAAAKPAKKATTTKKTAAKPKANTAKPRKTSTAAPAIVEQPKVITKTKSGRVTKTAAQPAAKPTVKKATPKKSTTPKKKAAA